MHIRSSPNGQATLLLEPQPQSANIWNSHIAMTNFPLRLPPKISQNMPLTITADPTRMVRTPTHHHHHGNQRNYTYFNHQTTTRSPHPPNKICKLIESFSQIAIRYLTHILLNKWNLERKNKRWYHWLNWTPTNTLTLTNGPPMKTRTKPPPPRVPMDACWKRWTNIACQCTNVDVPINYYLI